MMKLKDDPEKWLKGYSTPCRKPSNERVCDVRTRQPTKFVEQTSDRGCMTIIFFNKTGSTTFNSFELLDIFGRIWIPRCSGILQVGTNKGQIGKTFSFLRTTIRIMPNKVESLVALRQIFEMCSCHVYVAVFVVQVSV